ncbi:MAG TPA: DUF4062 domain-containing protein, partial [Candidatus Sulfopaludibacter sp.]|nr:DUF4062 domain-containing protein [Candidatus Sulfopaludibacter sp.]
MLYRIRFRGERLMRKPSIFVSSTCYDLRQVRADLHSYLENAGLDPVLSEFPCFPVDPACPTVENCRKAVEHRADVLVLIIGGRYGSTDDQGRSISNLEYLAAKAKGIPIYVFVMRSLLDILPVWADNPTGDFRSVADSPKVFEFISGIRNSGEKWVFPFDTAQDIVSTLRTQLSYLFADALELRKRASTSGALSEKYKRVSGTELRLLIDKPGGWEYLLFGYALEREISSHADTKRDWDYGISLGNTQCMMASEFMNYCSHKDSEAIHTATLAEEVCRQSLSKAFGPRGVPGDPDEILYAAARLGGIYRQILEWKLSFYRLVIPLAVREFRAAQSRLCDQVVTDIEQFSKDYLPKITAGMEAAKTARAGVVLELPLTLNFTTPNLLEVHK